jgi:hypothetical protein
VLDCEVEDIEFLETLRDDIEDGLTESIVETIALSASDLTLRLGKPWPGTVDATGVRIYLVLSAVNSPVCTLTSPRGTEWNITIAETEAFYENREDFLGEPAGGVWTLTLSDIVGANFLEWYLTVSNSVDSAQIYNFYAIRDPDLGGTPDLDEANRLFNRTALAHMLTAVAERDAIIVDDPHSLVDRDPVGE